MNDDRIEKCANEIIEVLEQREWKLYEETAADFRDIIRRHAKPVTDKIAELEAENAQLQACHDAELGVCEEHCDVVQGLKAALKREIDGAVEYHALLSEHLTDSVNAGLALKKELAEAQELNLRLTDKIWELEKECKHTQKGGQNETQDD